MTISKFTASSAQDTPWLVGSLGQTKVFKKTSKSLQNASGHGKVVADSFGGDSGNFKTKGTIGLWGASGTGESLCSSLGQPSSQERRTTSRRYDCTRAATCVREKPGTTRLVGTKPHSSRHEGQGPQVLRKENRQLCLDCNSRSSGQDQKKWLVSWWSWPHSVHEGVERRPAWNKREFVHTASVRMQRNKRRQCGDSTVCSERCKVATRSTPKCWTPSKCLCKANACFHPCKRVASRRWCARASGFTREISKATPSWVRRKQAEGQDHSIRSSKCHSKVIGPRGRRARCWRAVSHQDCHVATSTKPRERHLWRVRKHWQTWAWKGSVRCAWVKRSKTACEERKRLRKSQIAITTALRSRDKTPSPTKEVSKP